MPPIGHMDWIGLDLENLTHVQLATSSQLLPTSSRGGQQMDRPMT